MGKWPIAHNQTAVMSLTTVNKVRRKPMFAPRRGNKLFPEQLCGKRAAHCWRLTCVRLLLLQTLHPLHRPLLAVHRSLLDLLVPALHRVFVPRLKKRLKAL